MAVIPALARGGAERVFCLLTKEWAKRFDVVGVLLDGSRRAYECGGRVVDCELNVATGRVRKLQVAVRSVMRLVRLIREERPSEIISFMEPASIPTAVAAALCGGLGRVTVSVRNNPGSLPLGRRVIMRLCYRFVRRVVAPVARSGATFDEDGDSGSEDLDNPEPGGDQASGGVRTALATAVSFRAWSGAAASAKGI